MPYRGIMTARNHRSPVRKAYPLGNDRAGRTQPMVMRLSTGSQ